MKHSLALLALFSVGSFASIALAETVGFQLPTLLNAEAALGLFVSAFALLLMSVDYGAGHRSLDIRRTQRRLLPAKQAFVSCPSLAGHRGIRGRRVVSALVSR